MNYDEYPRSAAWKRVRERVRRRARGWCERCKVGKRADVHHLSYERLGNELPEDLVAVCRPCHEFLHGVHSKDPAAETYTKDEVRMVRHLTELCSLWPGLVEWTIDAHPEYEAPWQKRLASLESDVQR